MNARSPVCRYSSVGRETGSRPRIQTCHPNPRPFARHSELLGVSFYVAPLGLCFCPSQCCSIVLTYVVVNRPER
jgi:hypothetical protein